jgi:cytochrome c nitrite reductase small subunit
MVYGVVCFALLLSFVGTVLGGIWADQSWGRFWGWDPKENGAALVVLINAIILHARWGGFIRQRGIMVLAVAGNIVTAWSWFGTNMLGVGLHSYGFMDSAVFWLMAFVVTQLLIMRWAAARRSSGAALLGMLAGWARSPSATATGRAYLSNDPAACANCHVMQDHYDSWQNSSHKDVATCNDCHLSHHPIGKWITKADNGFFHSLAFTTGVFPSRSGSSPATGASRRTPACTATPTSSTACSPPNPAATCSRASIATATWATPTADPAGQGRREPGP